MHAGQRRGRFIMVTFDSDGNIHSRQQDIPFTIDSGGVVFCPCIDMLRAMPATTLRVRLLAVDARGERTLGDYTFNHTPYGPQRPE